MHQGRRDGALRRRARRRDRRRRALRRRARRSAPSSWPTTRCCCPAWSTPTCTSTSPAAPSGRASPPPPGPPRPAASRRSSTCRSTASRRRARSRRSRSSARPRAGKCLRRRRLLGRRRSPATSPTCAALHDAGRVRLQVLPAALGRRRVPAAGGRASSRRTSRSSARSTALMIVHAEDGDAIERAPSAHGRAYADFLALAPARRGERRHRARSSRPPGTPAAGVHILHLSSSDAVPMLRTGAARRHRASPSRPARTTSSSRPRRSPTGATQFKCCPPDPRGGQPRAALGARWADGDIDCVVSDHSPCTPELKRLDLGDFGAAWGGIASLQVGLPAVWTEARRRGYALVDVVRWMAERPADDRGPPAEGPDRASAATPTSSSSRPTTTFVVDAAAPAPPQPRHALRRTAPLAGVVRAAPGCAARHRSNRGARARRRRADS